MTDNPESLYDRLYSAAYMTRLGRAIIESRTLYRLDRAKWWVFHRFHPKHRYHMLNTGLGYGWRDRRVVLPHVMVNLLVDFVEKEKPFEWFDTEASGNAAEWAKLRDIYDRCKAWQAKPHSFVSFEQRKLDEAELTELLIDIVKIRSILWT